MLLIPLSLIPEFRHHLIWELQQYRPDFAADFGQLRMPFALARNDSNADLERAWQWVFPQQTRWRDISSGRQTRHSIDPALVPRAVK